MSLIVEPDIYTPSINEQGNYYDKHCSSVVIKNGLRCPCGTRKIDTIFYEISKLTIHCKTSKHHKEWIINLNLNKNNFYVENIMLRELVQNQKLIIAEIQKGINEKNIIISSLTEQLISFQNNKFVDNLIIFD